MNSIGRRTGSSRTGWTRGRGRDGIPEVNPRARMRHYCLLFRTSIPNEPARFAGSPKGEREKGIPRKGAKEKRRDRKTVFASGHSVFGICFLVEVNGHRFRLFLFFFSSPGGDRKSTVMFARSRESERARYEKKGSTSRISGIENPSSTTRSAEA